MNTHPDLSCDLFVIGQGLTGMSAALFAANRGLTVCQTGRSHPLVFHSGLFDLLGALPTHMKTNVADPWEAIEDLKKKNRNHPYSKVNKRDIKEAFNEIKTFLSSEGLVYDDASGKNSELITSIGTVKTSYLIPLSMRSAVSALKEKSPTLIVDIKGLREFSAIQIKETLNKSWPDITTATLDFSFGQKGEKTAEHLARALDLEQNRDILVNAILPHLKHEKAVGLPPILGIHKSTEAIRDMERKLGVTVFEIPFLPPSPPGVRLKETFEQGLEKKGVIRFGNAQIDVVTANDDGTFTVTLSSDYMKKTVLAQGIVLASGRFMGKGLVADRKKVREPIFDIPVVQPETREGWYRNLFFDKRGHDINKAGLVTDSFQRPLGQDGAVLYDRLFAAGSILAYQDWTREKCGSGIALATGFNAVCSFIELNESAFFDVNCLSA